MIPKIIWQTYKISYDQLPKYILEYTQTWQSQNPDWEYRYMSDIDCKEFVEKYFGAEWLNIYNSYPHNVMRADLWRYMILYIYGGVYADLDTKCLNPISTWLQDNLNMVISLDVDYINCNQFCFASSPKNPIMASVLDVIKEEFYKPHQFKNKVDCVYTLTGPYIFTKGIRKALEIVGEEHMMDDYIKYNASPKAKEYKFKCFGGDDWGILNKDSVHHAVASVNWKDQYIPWQIQET